MSTDAKDKRLALELEVFIRLHLKEDLTIDALTGYFQVSGFTLQRVCRKVFHRSVHQFILDKRLEIAYTLIKDNKLPIKQIVSETGFKSVTTFTKEFHRKYNVTPGALRDAI